MRSGRERVRSYSRSRTQPGGSVASIPSRNRSTTAGSPRYSEERQSRSETNGSTTTMCAPPDGFRESLYNTGFRRSRLTRRVRRLLAADLALVVGEEFGRDLSLKLSMDSLSLGLPGLVNNLLIPGRG